MTEYTPTGDELGLARSFEHHGFQARVYVMKTASGLVFGHVDVHERGVHKCRIVLTGHVDHGAALVALEGKCKDWISARLRGESDGNARFDLM